MSVIQSIGINTRISPFQANSPQQATALEINADNIGKMDIKNLGTLSKVAHFIMSGHILNQRNIEGLNKLQERLEERIYDLKNATTTSGIRGFFNYLFKSEKKIAEGTRELDYIRKLNSLIESVRSAQIQKPMGLLVAPISHGPISPSGKTFPTSSPVPTTADKSSATSNSAPTPVDKAPTIPTPVPTTADKSPATSNSAPTPVDRAPTTPTPAPITASNALAKPNLTSIVSSAPVPHKDDNSADSVKIEVPPPGAHDAPPMDGIPPPPEAPFDAPPMDGIPPPPGDFSSVAPTPAAPKKFAGEPEEPAGINPGALARELKTMLKAKLEREIAEIEQFVEAMKGALTPINDAIKREIDLTEGLKESDKGVAEARKKVQQYRAQQIALVNGKKAALIIKKDKKTGKTTTKAIKLYSSQEFIEENKARATRGAKPIPTQLLRSEQLIMASEKLTEAQERQEYFEDLIKDSNSELESLKAQKNNEIPFSEYPEVLVERNRVLSKWNSALNLRKKKLEDLLKPVEAPKTVVVQAGPKSEYDELLQDHDAAILMRGDISDKLEFEEE